jgi:hypothetical protein
MGAGRPLWVVGGVVVAVARVLAGAAVVDGLGAVVVSACPAESGEFELHALPHNIATTRAPAIGGSLRITTRLSRSEPNSQSPAGTLTTFLPSHAA